MNTKQRKGDDSALVVVPGGDGGQGRRYREFVDSGCVDERKIGDVIVRIFEHRTHSSRTVYDLELVREYLMDGGCGEAFNFLRTDLVHAIRCLKWARDWFWHHERNRAMRRATNSSPMRGQVVTRSEPLATHAARGDKQRELAGSRRVDGEQRGNVAVRVFENWTSSRETIFKVELVRIYTAGRKAGDGFRFRKEDIRDAISCLKWSAAWLRREETGRLPFLSRFWS